MRIGVDISQIVYEGTGAATYTKELLKQILLQDKTNQYVLFAGTLRLQHRLHTFTQSLPVKVEEKFVFLPPTILNILWNELHFMPVETFTGKVDIFHASDATQPPAKAKKVTTVHDLVAYHFPETLHPKQVNIQKKRLAWIKKEADKIITVSEATKNDLMHLLEIPPEKIAVIYEGVNSNFTSTVRDNAEVLQRVRNKYKLPEKFLLYVGTMQPRKNLPRLLEAYTKRKQEIPLVIAGKFGWGTTLQAVPNVHMVGYIKDDDLPSIYAMAYAFLYPALYEGFGLPILEAMACGTPVVASKTSSMPEVGGTAAFYIDPNDTVSIFEGIEQVLGLSPDDYKNMQQKSVEQAQKFSWQRAAEQTLEIYNSLI